MKTALLSGHNMLSQYGTIFCWTPPQKISFDSFANALYDSCRWRFMGRTPALQYETRVGRKKRKSHLHAQTVIPLPQSNTWRSDYSMPALSFKPCQGFCGEFTAECTHCSFPSSTIKEHLMEEYGPNIKWITHNSMTSLSCGKLL